MNDTQCAILKLDDGAYFYLDASKRTVEKGETIALSPFHVCTFEGAKVRNELLFITISRRHNRQ
jgi:hypothetical protein